MTIARIAFGLLLLTAPIVGAQQAAKRPSSEPGTGVRRTKPVKIEHESFQITIIFRRYFNDKRVTDRSYTLLATTGETLPAIRDDLHYRADLADNKGALNLDIDVDVLGLRRAGTSIYVALRVSTLGFELDDHQGPAKLPIVVATHQFLVTPTIPIGRLVTVYSATQVLIAHRDEIQLEVQPFDSNGSAPHRAAAPRNPSTHFATADKRSHRC